jgi:flagellar biosynthetic protein FliQ
VPKILAILIVTAFTAPFVGAVIFSFAEQTYARIPNGF